MSENILHTSKFRRTLTVKITGTAYHLAIEVPNQCIVSLAASYFLSQHTYSYIIIVSIAACRIFR